ncbi:MAG: riboflavin synthase [Nitrospirae bacterium]|nr:riboflavin synthase [Nitrospirota bacterium]
MFTGIIVEMGRVAAFGRKPAGASLAVSSDAVAKEASLGDSIAVNGVCLTVVKRQGAVLCFDLSDETLRSTNLGRLVSGDRVNLEPSLRPDGKLGGHFVTGHVDAVGTIGSKKVLGDALEVVIEAPEKVTDLLVEKGSVAVDGISLTVVDVAKDRFFVVIIPHTAGVTSLGFKAPGETVNLEADIIGKYVARFVKKEGAGNSGGSGRLMQSLRQAGYIQEE